MKFTTKREQQFFIFCTIALLWAFYFFILLLLSFFRQTEGNEAGIGLAVSGILFVVSAFIAFRSFYYRQRKKLFYNKGIKYPARIIKADVRINHRSNNTYYLYLVFIRNNKKMILRTSAYTFNPNDVLKSPYCSVYCINNKFIEGNFDLRIKPDYSAPRIIPITPLNVR